MNISIIHPSLNPKGGAERLCLTMVEALKEKGYTVLLGTLEKTNWSEVEKSFNDVVKPDKEIVVPRKMPFLGTYGQILQVLHTSKICKHSDVTIVSDYFSSWTLYGLAFVKNLVLYVHDPVVLPKKYWKGFWSFYYKPYSLLERLSLSKLKKVIVLANSEFSANTLKKVHGLNAKILYPPVDVENFFPSKKENLVVSVARFHPAKKFEMLIESFTNVRDANCVIIGSTYGKESKLYLLKLKKFINQLGLEKRVRLFVDCPFDLLQETLAKAKLYVHCMPSEFFGISIVEAMAAGCIPLVHRSGGPYIDIIDYDKYGFSFNDVPELSDKINVLLENDALRKEHVEKLRVRAKMFSKDVFKKNVTKIIDNLTVCKSNG
jgi:alpha-1,2-mannosyltransferase